MATESPDQETLKSFHFDCGNSTDGPIGFCARVVAATEQEAVQALQNYLKSLNYNVDILEDGQGAQPDSAGIDKGVEYLTVYFGPTEQSITVNDIDEVNDPITGDVLEEC